MRETEGTDEMSLALDEQRILLALARDTISRVTRGQQPPEVDVGAVSDALRRDGASFVTLTEDGQLRGCIGSLEARRPLVLDVRENAVSAALQDPRFPPVHEGEVDALHIEVSVLSAPERFEYEDAEDLLARLRPGVDGVIVERGWNRATFLPQVWEKLPDARHFLGHLCVKAYLPAEAYRDPGLDVYTYQVQKFEELPTER